MAPPVAEDARSHGGHVHGVSADADVRWLGGALALIVALFVVEVVVAAVTGSLALLADAGHLLTDAAALGLSVWAIRLAARPAGGRWTYGFTRAEVLSALANGISLLVIAAVITVEAVQRLVHPSAVPGTPLLVVALIGVAVNLLAVRMIGQADRSSLNVEGAFQHVLTDLFAFLGTAVAGLVIITTGARRADPIASLLVVVLMLVASYGLLRRSGEVLLEGAPTGVDLVEMAEHLTAAAHVHSLHDLHVWTVSSTLPALSAHVVVDDSCFTDGHAPQILDELQHCLIGHFDVEHSTFQLEPVSHATHEVGHHA